MPDARYLRAEAQQYLNLAESDSRSWAAPTLRMMAAECIEDAERIEAGEPGRPERRAGG
jgi:hypothetical protein